MSANRRNGLFAAMAFLLPFPASAQEAYPGRPIRLVVPFAAGGGVDVIARLIGRALSDNIGVGVTIDNRGGAGGINGMDAVAKAAPDGYTLLAAHSGFTAMPGLYAKLPFDPVKDFDGVIVATSGAYALAVATSLPVKSVAELVALAKAGPGKLNYGSAGIGSTVHLAGEFFKRSTGTNIVHVPYKGAGPALNDLVGGHINMMFGPVINVLPLHANGQLRALAVTSPKRSNLVPDMPTIAEAGVPGFEVVGWYGLAAPAGTPRTIIARINAEMSLALSSPALIDQLEKQGLEPVSGTPDQASALIKAEVARWTAIIREAGIKPQ
jgi:tripartite-type tricarboxylate transporter receptor subunit TctC